MPLSVTKKETTVTRTIDTAKITELNIDVRRKVIEIMVEFGTIKNNEMQAVKRQLIKLQDEEFTSLAATLTTGNKTIYDEISDVAYNWLTVNNKLQY